MKRITANLLSALIGILFAGSVTAAPLHLTSLPFNPSSPHDFTSGSWDNKVVIHPEAFPDFDLANKTYTLSIRCSGGIQLGTARWNGSEESDFAQCGEAGSDEKFVIDAYVAARIAGGYCFQLNSGSGSLSSVELTVTDGGSVKPVETGFHTDGTRLLDANGNEFVMRGLNYSYAWQSNLSWVIKSTADWGCNAIRINIGDGSSSERDGNGWLGYTDRNTLAWLIQECENNHLIGVFAPHNQTGSDSHDDLMKAADYWAGMASLLNEHTKTVIVNVTNEWMQSEDARHWSEGYVKAITRMRGAGIKNTIVVDVAGYGQGASVLDADGGRWARAIIDADPDKNIMFSIHMYHVSGQTPEIARRNIDYGLALDVPMLVGEFAFEHKAHKAWPEGGPVAWQAILDHCYNQSVGFLAWSWTGNGGDAETCDMFDGSGNILENGKCMFYGDKGIKMTSVPCSVYDDAPGHDMAYAWPEGPFGFEPYEGGYKDIVFTGPDRPSGTGYYNHPLPYRCDDWTGYEFHILPSFFADATDGCRVVVEISGYGSGSQFQIAYNHQDKGSDSWTKLVDDSYIDQSVHIIPIGSATTSSDKLRARELDAIQLRHLIADGLYIKGKQFSVENVTLLDKNGNDISPDKIQTSIDRITTDAIDPDEPFEIYNITGMRVDSMSTGGIYIIRQGGRTFKIMK